MPLKKFFPFLALILVPLSVFAAEHYVYEVELIPESIENVIELVNVVLAVLAAAYAIKLAALTQGGAMEKTWNLLAVASVAFALVEIVNGLKGFGFMHIGGLDDMLELAFVALLLTVFVQTRKALLKQVMGK